ncbi:MAG: DegT/DnrJ/EryC1/StrS family aminotransferase, partial [Myxococcota bacterium]
MAPSWESTIPLARPALGDDESRAADRVLRSGRLVLGPENVRFEEQLATLTGRAHAVCVTSGTTALELVLWALDLGPKRGRPTPELLVPAAGFPAAANAALRMGAVPIPVDIDPHAWTMDTAAAAAAIGPATVALVSVDTFGLVAEAEPLRQLVADAGIALIDDAACSLGGRDSAGVPGGGYGVAGSLSFHPRKVITTGEGGAVVCDDSELAETLRQLRNQGQSFGPDGRRFARVGSNARLGEMAAAIGCVQLGRLDALLRERALLVAGYRERLGEQRAAGALTWQDGGETARSAHQTFAVQLAPDRDRDAVQRRLAEAGIESGPAVFALHWLDSFGQLPGMSDRRLPVAEALHRRGLALPLFPGMRSAE